MNIFSKKTNFWVYDDQHEEFEKFMNGRQLREFALCRLKEYYNMVTDEELEDEIEICISEDKKDRIKEIITDFFNSKNGYKEENYVNKITVKDATELLKLSCFKVEEQRS